MTAVFSNALYKVVFEQDAHELLELRVRGDDCVSCQGIVAIAITAVLGEPKQALFTIGDRKWFSQVVNNHKGEVEGCAVSFDVALELVEVGNTWPGDVRIGK